MASLRILSGDRVVQLEACLCSSHSLQGSEFIQSAGIPERLPPGVEPCFGLSTRRPVGVVWRRRATTLLLTLLCATLVYSWGDIASWESVHVVTIPSILALGIQICWTWTKPVGAYILSVHDLGIYAASYNTWGAQIESQFIRATDIVDVLLYEHVSTTGVAFQLGIVKQKKGSNTTEERETNAQKQKKKKDGVALEKTLVCLFDGLPLRLPQLQQAYQALDLHLHKEAPRDALAR